VGDHFSSFNNFGDASSSSEPEHNRIQWCPITKCHTNPYATIGCNAIFSADSRIMIHIDGAQGEGGGQIVRSSLALSMLTNQPFTLTNVRARRSNPGLQRQHLTAVLAAAEVSQAVAVGAKLRAKEFSFHPSRIVAGDYHFDIGSAGSVTLVLQTIMPALMTLPQHSTIQIAGGTHNTMAPPFDFLVQAYLPLLGKIGFSIECELIRPGFYPAGGGMIKATIQPFAAARSLDILDRGKLLKRKIVALLSRLPKSIGEKEISQCCRKLQWKSKEGEIQTFENSRSAGNVCIAQLRYENLTEVMTEFGKPGLPSESVADRLVRQVNAYLKSEVPIGPHLADQLLLPLGISAHLAATKQAETKDAATTESATHVTAKNDKTMHDAVSHSALGGGKFLTGPLTDHSLTHITVLKSFLNIKITQHSENGKTLVEVLPKPTQTLPS